MNRTEEAKTALIAGIEMNSSNTLAGFVFVLKLTKWPCSRTECVCLAACCLYTQSDSFKDTMLTKIESY